VGSPAIVFIGFMGAGKSAALAVEEAAGRTTADTDRLLERQLGMTIEEFFAREGEIAFRAREEELVLGALAEAAGGAVALGGGSVLSEPVREALSDHVVVWLEVDAETAWSRAAGRGRPLARDRGAFEALLAERTPIYEALADVVVPSDDKAAIAAAIAATRETAERGPLGKGARMIWAASRSGSYPIFVGRGLLGAGGGEWWPCAGRPFCVTDATVGPLYLERLPAMAATVEVPPGEEAKSMAEAERVLRELAQAGMNRDDHLVALGGGVVGDLGGFCAHLYQRGVPVVQVPTTLVAQVDSAYGGKTGVDLPEGKNYAGAYQLPAAVLADTDTLASLPPADLAAGFVEALKTGLLAGGSLWERVRSIESLDPAALDDVVFACARYKCEVVAADHAIEAAGGYGRYRHGEAIGLGVLAALRLSEAPALRAEVEAVLVRHGLPTRLDAGADVEAILALLQRDKKRTAAGVGFVLLAEPGEPRIGQLVEPARVRAAVEELLP